MTSGSPLSRPHACSTADRSFAINPTAGGSTANNIIANSSIAGSMSYQTEPKESLSQLASAPLLPPQDTASASAARAVAPTASNGQMESSLPARSVFINNYTVQVQPSTTIHNTVRSLKEMNVGNSHYTNVEGPDGSHAVGPTPNIPVLELPEELMRPSLGQDQISLQEHSQDENGVRQQSVEYPYQECQQDQDEDDERRWGQPRNLRPVDQLDGCHRREGNGGWEEGCLL